MVCRKTCLSHLGHAYPHKESLGSRVVMMQFQSLCEILLPPLFPQALKILRTSEFLPFVVFIEAPDFEVLKAMNRSAIEAGIATKQLTVG